MVKIRWNISANDSYDFERLDVFEFKKIYNYELTLDTSDFHEVFDNEDLRFDYKPYFSSFEKSSFYETTPFLEKFNIYQHKTSKVYVFLYAPNKVYPFYNISLGIFHRKLGAQYIQQFGGLPSLEKLQREIGRTIRKVPDINQTGKGTHKNGELFAWNLPIEGIKIEQGYNCSHCHGCCVEKKRILAHRLYNHYKAVHPLVPFVKTNDYDLYKKVLVQEICPGAGGGIKFGKKRLLVGYTPFGYFKDCPPSINSFSFASSAPTLNQSSIMSY